MEVEWNLLQISAALMMVSTLFSGAAAFWPNPKWVTERKPLISTETTVSDRKLLPAIFKSLSVITSMALVTLVFVLILGLPFLFSVVCGIGVIGLAMPLVVDTKNKKREKIARKEALRLATYVMGRLTARASLHGALSSAASKFRDGTMDMEMMGDDLTELVQAVELGEDMTTNLYALAARFEHIAEISGLFKNYAIMSRSNLGPDARARHAEDTAKELARLDAIKNDLDVELTASRGTRLVMMLLMVGLVLYLVLGGGPVGYSLIHTIPGNLAIGVAFFALAIAQIVATRIEKMPVMRF